ncbi:Ascorbate transporter protein [Thalictrum thalictroides]|uniref:non-specific serine/threonine protein kinase n=2 Tax=Magnoliopsida TaxID=3398 RepID=A0A7J6V0P8_THATH|nr:Ascorbate transporter protein [Thalictrum thalictroides]
MAEMLMLFFMVFCFVGFELVSAATDPRDAVALQSLRNQWKNLPPSWDRSPNDPCGAGWEGITCNGTRVTALGLSTMNIVGTLNGGDIGGLSELTSLDLSFNKDLTGSLSPSIGELTKLNILILAGCGFTGNIPKEIGKLTDLTFLALNSNSFSGTIPATLGNLSNLYWLDLADNQLTGSIPVSTINSPGLDQLLNAKHFHFNKNKLSGEISPTLFNPQMILIHVLFDGNQLTGEIPETLGYVKTLEVLRLDRNSFSGAVPSNLKNLTSLSELHLAGNELTGPVPDLREMNSLNYVDLSNNSFAESTAPIWFSTLKSLTTLVMENGQLVGPVPQLLFSFPQLQQVKLKNNQLNDTLDMGNSISQQLQLVDLANNEISSITLSSEYKNVLILLGNPVCDVLPNTYCNSQQPLRDSYSTSLARCGPKTCISNQKVNPQSCECALPYDGTLYFRAPSFRDLTNATVFQDLERSLWTKLGLTPGSVFLEKPVFNENDYLQVQLDLFPTIGKYFNRTEILTIGFELSHQTYKPPPKFGPYYFLASPYDFHDGKGGTSFSLGVIIGIAVGCSLLILTLVLVGVYAVRQKKRAERAIELSRPFASWAPSGKDSGGAPQLKGARWFSYDELKKCTNNFLDSNEVGSGGYGKVYRGLLPNGQVVAIKRAQQNSMQGGFEFKTEIELLSRVHHKNLVSLVGFCFEQGEQMLVYEFIPNGTLRDSLSGRSGIYLDWKRRLRITLDFGLSKLVNDIAKGHVSTQVKGTLGYLDPEYYMTQQLTEKSDVYSFGVVMLELITSKQPIEKGKYIVREVRTRLDKNDTQYYGLRELMDPIIRTEANLVGFGKFIELAMQCVEESAADRPSMGDMVKEIETMLHNDGLNTNSTSATSSATEFDNTKGRHPYSDVQQRKDASTSATDLDSKDEYTKGSHPYNGDLPKKTNSGSFEYSGGDISFWARTASLLESGLIALSSFLWGYLVSSVFAGALTDKYGGKKAMACGVAIWSLATILTPFAAERSTPLLLAVRALFGLAEGVALPSMNTLLSRWFPNQERASAVGISMAGFHLGNVIGFLLTPIMMSTTGISGPFTLFACLGFFWLTVWALAIRNDPRDSHLISSAELRLIQAGKTDSPTKNGKVPTLRQLLSKLPTWALILANVTNNWGYFVLLSWMPVYFKTVFNVNLKQAAWFSAIPWGMMAISGYIAGLASDALIKSGYSITSVRKIMQSIGFIGPGLGLLCLNYVKTPTAAAVLFTAALSFSSFSQAGFLLNMQDIAPQCAGFLHGITNCAGTFAAIISTIGTGYFVQWLGSFQAFLTVTAVLYFATTVFWNLYATGERVFY